MEFEYKCVGWSSDKKANLWRVMCSCKKVFNPPTTMLSTQSVECPKCGKREVVNYNEVVESKLYF